MRRILTYGEKLRPQLQNLLETAAHAKTASAWERDFLGRMVPFVSGGKQLRGGLLCCAYEIFSGQPADEQILQVAMALELTHSALLIHDDIMDRDRLRRGQPSLHWQYQRWAEGRQMTDSEQFGLSLAMCGGDALCFLAFELLGTVQAKPTVYRELQRSFAHCLTRTCYGQMQDVFFDTLTTLPTKSAIYELMKTKTAAYTLSLPLAMGAILAGQKDGVVKRLETVGYRAGIIYQIRDDELGVLGEESAIGKPVGSDIREGKKTLLYYYLMKQSPAIERRRLQALFGKRSPSADDLAYIQQLVHEYGVLQCLEREVERLTTRAAHGIKQLHLEEAATQELNELLRFCATRQW